MARRRFWRPVLAPRPGRRLPRELSPNRVGLLAAALPEGLDDPGFTALLSRIEQSPIHAGNRVRVFFRGQDAFAAMLEDLSAATSEILLETYILRDDDTGKRFQEALAAAAARGVRVRVLADAFGSMHMSRRFWRAFAGAGVEARLFHGLGVPFKRLLFRDHRKILVVDRRVAYTGGMNIGDEYGSSVIPRERVFRDTHARVEGPVAAEMAAVFREGWLRADGAPFSLEPVACGDAAGARVMVLDSRPGRGAREVSSALASIAGGARRRLWITEAYFAPRRRVTGILGRAVARGVDVRLLLPGRTDVRTVRHAGHGFFSGLLRRGVRLFEYRAAVLHAKTLVADGEVSLIGSSNLDFRSFERNAECNFVVFDAPVAEEMERQFLADLAESTEVLREDWRRRSWAHRSLDALARRLAPIL
ncbi:MAG: phospholipase D-like domain-containing protein [Syntrophomonadaceae bacterium]